MAPYAFASLLAVIFLLGDVANSQLYVNTRCFILGPGQQGVCRSSRECDLAIQRFRYTGVRPANCRFTGESVIVCCINCIRNNPGNNNNDQSGGGVTVRYPGDVGAKPDKEKENIINQNDYVDGDILNSTDIIQRSNENKSISERKCETYSSSNIDLYYRHLEPEIGDYIPILNGTVVDMGEFPHMALIGWPLINSREFKWACGGSLISENFILTAAHCASLDRDTTVSNVEPTIVRLGAHSISQSGKGARHIDIRIGSIIVHPSYIAPSKYHDIALIRMSRNASFEDHIRPACLAHRITSEEQPLIATGWGKIAYDNSPSDVLMKVRIKTIAGSLCASLYSGLSKTSLRRGIIEQQICAGEKGKDTCQGDSGGPLQAHEQYIYRIIGVTSFGVGCGNSPGVYTSVAHYHKWVERVVWPSG